MFCLKIVILIWLVFLEKFVDCCLMVIFFSYLWIMKKCGRNLKGNCFGTLRFGWKDYAISWLWLKFSILQHIFLVFVCDLIPKPNHIIPKEMINTNNKNGISLQLIKLSIESSKHNHKGVNVKVWIVVK